jgi:hypothetical protein
MHPNFPPKIWIEAREHVLSAILGAGNPNSFPSPVPEFWRIEV